MVVWKQTEVGGEWTSDRLSKFPAAVWRVSWSITGNILAVQDAPSSPRCLFLSPTSSTLYSPAKAVVVERG